MKQNIYIAPVTEICLLQTKDPHMIGADPGEETSNQMANGVQWDAMFNGLEEDIEEPSAPSERHTPSKLWDE